MSQVDVSFCPASAEPSPPESDRERQTCHARFHRGHTLPVCLLKHSCFFQTCNKAPRQWLLSQRDTTLRNQPWTTQVHLHSAISRHNPRQAISFIHSLFLPPLSSLHPLPSLIYHSQIPADLFGVPLLFHRADFLALWVRRLLGGGVGTGVRLMAA